MENLPKNYNFQEREEYWQKFWEENEVFKFDPKSEKPLFSVDTPPPTVSGKVHVGHSSSYSQGDMVVRFQRMSGKNIFYPFGTDDNGLATQRLVEKEKKVRAVKMGRDKFVKLVLDTLSKELRPSYLKDFKQLGLSCDFTLSYTTINERCRRLSQWSFLDFYKKKRAYRKETPAMCCPVCRTAISQVELEDKELESTFNTIVFKVDNKDLLIATTRPELLPACVAIFYHPDDKRYQPLAGKKARVPLFNFEVPIMADARVDKDKGTGIVMNCTFGDQMDMEWQKAYNLPIKEAITPDGKMSKLSGKYEGLVIAEAREKIIADLKTAGLLTDQKKIKHQVNVHERCGTEIEFLKSKQWFFKYLDLKKQMLAWGEKLNWLPAYMKNRYDNWVNGLQWDWCISRQIYYGVPFPLWYCDKCGEVILAEEKSLPVDPIKDRPPVDKCPHCGHDKIIPETDVMCTWATSSLTPQIGAELAKERGYKKEVYPQTLRLQAHDIISFWLFNTVFKSQVHFEKNPFRDVLVSGWVLDSKGKKMSKSKGNVVEPQKVFAEFGVDAFRYWAAGAAPGTDHNYNQEEVRVGKKTVTKLWNAGKFCFGHLRGFDPQSAPGELEAVDKWILQRLSVSIAELITPAWEKYNYAQALNFTDKFFWRDFTDRYLEFVKYRLYGADEKSKQAAQYTLYKVFLAILKLYAPITPYITEELYRVYYKEFEKATSIHVSGWPETAETKIPAGFDRVIDLIDEIRKYKSDNDLSMGKEIDEYQAKVKIDDKYKSFVQQAMRVKNLN
jgi:valyl-tRNA synthetase